MPFVCRCLISFLCNLIEEKPSAKDETVLAADEEVKIIHLMHKLYLFPKSRTKVLIIRMC